MEVAESFGESTDRVGGHGVVDSSGGGGDLGGGVAVEVEVWVDGDAVSADGDAGLVDVAERLAVAGLDDLGDVDVVLVGVAGEFVGEPDVDVAVRRLGQLGEFGGFAGAEIPYTVGSGQVVAVVELQHRFVEADRQFGAGLVDAADEFRVAAQIGEHSTGIDPFRAEGDEQVLAEGQTGTGRQRRGEAVASGARPAAWSRRPPATPASSPAAIAAVA